MNTDGGNFGRVVVVVVVVVVLVVVVVVLVTTADDFEPAPATCCRAERPAKATATISSTAMPAANRTIGSNALTANANLGS